MSTVVDLAAKPDRPGQWTGAIWPIRVSINAGNSWAKIAYGMGTYVIINDSGIANCVCYSIDKGITWNQVAGAAANQWRGIAYGNKIFIKIAQNGVGNQIGRSIDYGKTWSSIAEPVGANLQYQDVCYAGQNTFVAVAQDGVGIQFLRSVDGGLTWTSVAEPATLQWQAVFANPITGVVCAVAQNGAGNQIARSTNRGAAGSWASIAEPQTQTWRDICWGKNIWFACGLDSLGVNRSIMYSHDDGITWNSAYNNNGWDLICCAYGYDRFIAIKSVSDISTYISYDGSYNFVYTSPSSQNVVIKDVVYGSDRFVAVGNNQVAIS